MITRILFFQPITGVLGNIGLLVFRVTIGLTMAFAHGVGKVPPPDGLVKGVASMGFFLPEMFAWAAGLSELVGGICVALGLLTRINASFLCVTMAVAVFVRHASDPFATKEKAILFLVSFVLLMLVGAGRYSADALFSKR